MCWPTSWRVLSAGSAGPGWVAPGPVPPVAAPALAAVVTASSSTAATASGRRATVTEARNTCGGVSMRASGVLPDQRRGHDARGLQVNRMAGARHDQRPRTGDARDHALCELGVRAVTLPGDRGDRHAKLAEACPQ